MAMAPAQGRITIVLNKEVADRHRLRSARRPRDLTGADAARKGQYDSNNGANPALILTHPNSAKETSSTPVSCNASRTRGDLRASSSRSRLAFSRVRVAFSSAVQ
jgi:hypothetical protein